MNRWDPPHGLYSDRLNMDLPLSPLPKSQRNGEWERETEPEREQACKIDRQAK